jgi:hypothetical protein
MLMRNQHGIQPADVFANSRQPLCDFAAAQTGIDQHARPVRRDER